MKIIKRIVLGLLFLLLAGSIGGAQDNSRLKTEGKYTFHSDWFSHNIPNWNRVLGEMKGKPNLNYLEVGTYEGRSFFWVMDNILTHPSSRAVAIDTFDKFGPSDPEVVFRENMRRSGHSSKIKVVKGFSQQKMRDLKLNSFDLIYIDGDHTSKSVLMDAILAWDLLKDGGIIMFDDYNWDFALPTEMRPAFALDVFQALFRDNFQILLKDYQLIIRKTKTYCNNERGYIKVGEITLACSSIGQYTYYWKPKKLYDNSTKNEISLSDEEIPLIESALIKRKLGFQLEVEKIDIDLYNNLVDRLGLNEINVSSDAR